jgi:hypothetical protein
MPRKRDKKPGQTVSTRFEETAYAIMERQRHSAGMRSLGDGNFRSGIRSAEDDSVHMGKDGTWPLPLDKIFR